jgi:hypothetical protein
MPHLRDYRESMRMRRDPLQGTHCLASVPYAIKEDIRASRRTGDCRCFGSDPPAHRRIRPDWGAGHPDRVHSGANARIRPPAAAAHGKIAFTSDRSGVHEIWTMNADGTNPVDLTNNSAFDIRNGPNGANETALTSAATGEVDLYPDRQPITHSRALPAPAKIP